MARSRDYDADDAEDFEPRSSGGGAKGPLDGMYANTNIIILVLFGLCCGIIAFILSLVAYLTGKDPKAKSNALIVLVISGILSVLGIVAQLTGAIAGMQGAR